MNIKHISGWATSAGGRPIDLYHSSESQWENLDSPLVFIGGVHGDEPEGVALAESTLHWLMKDGASLARTPWILITCLNPDGYANNQRVNDHGVDLNRNYPASNWSDQHSEKKYYPGPAPGSEPEVKALADLIVRTKPRLLVHCHSWKPCIVCTGSAGRTDAEYLSESSGYEIVDSIGYPTPGSLSHFGWHDHNIPVICIEEAERETKEKSWQRFSQGIQKMFMDGSKRNDR